MYMNIPSRLYALAIAAGATICSFAAVNFSGISEKAISVNAEASTGLEAIYVLPTTAGASMTYSGASESAKWYAFGNLGGAYAEEFATGATAPCRSGDCGYIVEDRGRQNCFWVVDYSLHELALESLAPSAERDCGRVALDFVGNAEEIVYYTINGRRSVLSRELLLEWQTLVFDEENFNYTTTPGKETIEGIHTVVSAPAPLCNTTFVLTGDRFLKAWGREQSIESSTVDAFAVDANTRATQTVREADNELKEGDNDGLGGSAPCEIEFEAAVTDAAIFTEWQISRTPEFTTLENSFKELVFSYTFTDQGTTYVRFIADNADGLCPYEGAVYEVFIGESKLDIPNAFSPEASPGVNDEWKVSYKSLVSYECHIFNRWGKELFASTDPAQGWDGKVGNKYVPSGVYFYVIKAVGSDGVKYNKSGDINIIKYKTSGQPSTSEPTEPAE